MRDMREIMNLSPVIPVATIPDGSDAVALANALTAGGISIIEVTLRSETAVESVRRIARSCPDICVGAGTVWTEAQAKSVIDAGASFIVSPGISMPVFEVCLEAGVPILPGAQTVTEIAHWVSCGLDAVKFFPAEIAGGVAALKAFAAVFPGLSFCPTGGVSLANARDYLDLPAVPCVGGSWLVASDDLANGNWQQVSEKAAEASELSM
ncbi:MAG: bifunctional 4-hydroxy-2-oxoglutarate aldolase/2-dehydro-3-deoxy-phosphogluconate aldolase [Pseudomonadota bacterium]